MGHHKSRMVHFQKLFGTLLCLSETVAHGPMQVKQIHAVAVLHASIKVCAVGRRSPAPPFSSAGSWCLLISLCIYRRSRRLSCWLLRVWSACAQGLRGYQELIANLVPLTGATRSKDLVPYMAVRHFHLFCKKTRRLITAWSTTMEILQSRCPPAILCFRLQQTPCL